MILWMMEDLDNGKCDLRPRERGRTPLAKGKEQEKMVHSHCRNCAKTGHQSKDCWARPQQQQSQGQSNSLGTGNDVKGKSGKGGEKKGRSKDGGALLWNHQTGSPVASSVASSAPQTEKRTTVGTIDTIERTALDLCATTMAQQEVMNPRDTNCT